MSLDSKSPLLKKRALDALLETMTTDDYQSLGGHGMDKGNVPYTSPIGGTGVSKGTEFENETNKNMGEINVVIPSKDLVPPPDPASAEFFKESEPKSAGRKPKCPHCGSGDYGLMPSDFETAKCNACGKNWDHGIVPGVNDPYEKTSAEQGFPSKDEILRILRQHPLVGLKEKPNRVFVIGSFARGEQRPDSDIDILLEVPGGGQELTELYRRKLQQYFVSNDLHGKHDEVHPQWNGRRVDVYFTSDADADDRPKIRIAAAKPVEEEIEQHEFYKKAPESEIDETPFSAAAGKLGIEYKGLLLDVPSYRLVHFTDPATGTGIDVPLDGFSEEKVKEHLNAARERFGKPKIAGHRVKDTGEYDEQHEEKIRSIAQETAQYYEHGPKFDPKGEYLCNGCHYMLGNKACAFVEGDISKEHGTCRYWKVADGKAPVELERKYNKKDAGYAERIDKPFGCQRCEYGFKAKKADSEGRESWCEFFGMHIEPNACCNENNLHGDIHFNTDNTKQASFVSLEEVKTSAKKTLYHVTNTSSVPSIKEKGILPLQTSNWVNGTGERYGEGEIFAMDNPVDAVRWASRMDWEFNKGMGTGKISIIVFTSGEEKWRTDSSDPLGQGQNKGRWLKTIGSVKPEQITASYVLAPDMIKSVVQTGDVKLGYDSKEIQEDYKKQIQDLEDAEKSTRKPSMKEQEERTTPKTADVPTKSYGMGTPIGGTDNPDAGASDEPEELQDPGELSLDMTSSLNEEEYDDYDYDAEDARLAALQEAEDRRGFRASILVAKRLDRVPFSVASFKVASFDDVGWFAKSARPTEQKIELLQKQFKLAPEQIELCVAADPSPNQSDFVAWLAKWLAKGAFQLPEDTEKMKGQLEMFQKFKKSPSFTFSKDIQQYDPAKLFETLQQATEAGMSSKKEEKRETVRKGADIVVQEGDIKIFKCTDANAVKELGGGTNWCTAAPGTDYAAHYLKDGPIYIFFDAGSAVAQLHPASNQFMNRLDVCILESVTGESTGYEVRQGVKKFLADPALAKALRLLTEKEPEVKEWVKENIADPEDVKKILGEAAAEEIEHNVGYEKELTQYEQDLVQYQKDVAQYEKDFAEYQDKQKEFQASPRYKRWQKQYDNYQKNYEDWYQRRQRGEDVEERPQAPREPEGPKEPPRPSQPYHPSRGELSYGWGERTVRGKKFSMQVRHALATGQPLSPEAEQQLVGAGVNTQLLLKYGALFHPGQPWEPLAQAILAKVQKNGKVDKEAIDYAVKFVKGRWPAVEPYLLNKLFLVTRNMENMQTALDYAIRVYKTRWPEFEAKIAKAKPGAASGYGAAEYAINVLKKPWSAFPDIKRKKNGKINAEECMIVGNPGEARKYAEAFNAGKKWDAFEESALAANNLAALVNYAADTLKARMPALEEKILSGQRDAQESKGRSRYRHYTDLPLDYAIKVIKGRWPEYEQKILEHTQNKIEKSHSKEYSPSWIQQWGDRNRLNKRLSNYIEKVIKGRWPEMEQVLLARYQEHPELWAQNQNFIDGYLTTIDAACQDRYKDNRPVPNEEVETDESDALGTVTQKPDARKQNTFTKFQQDPQCYWSEGEQRLATRDPGYEKILTDALRERAKEKNWGSSDESKYVSPEDLVKMEKAPAETSYEEKKTKPDFTIWNDMWIGWYGMDDIEKYTDYMLANNQTWKEGVDILELAEDLEDVRGRYSFQSRPNRRQPELAFQSSLLKKKALIEMQESPSLLPPRDDLKGHMDQQMHDQLTKEIMQGVREPLNPKKKIRRPQQIDPRINPDGVTAGKEAANPNLTVQKWRRKNPHEPIEKRPVSPFIEWLAEEARNGRSFLTTEEAQAAFDSLQGKTAEYSQEDQSRDEESQYFLDRVEDAEDEAKRHFMQEDYIQQLAHENSKTMDEMWDMVGEEYTAEFYGYPYKRVPDFTDESTRGISGLGGKRMSSVEDKAIETGKVSVRFLDKEIEFNDVNEALSYAQGASSEFPGEKAVFIIDEAGCVTEDTYVNGQHVGDTVELFK